MPCQRAGCTRCGVFVASRVPAAGLENALPPVGRLASEEDVVLILGIDPHEGSAHRGHAQRSQHSRSRAMR